MLTRLKFQKPTLLQKSHQSQSTLAQQERILKNLSDEVRVRKKDGSYIWIELRGRTFKDADGMVKALIIARDINKRKKIEQKLKKYEEKQCLILENANDLIFVLNKNIEFDYINEGVWKKLLSFSKDDLIGRKVLFFLHPKDVDKINKNFRESFNIGIGSEELRIRKKDGHYLYLEVKGNTFFDHQGEIKALLIARDITEKKKMKRN